MWTQIIVAIILTVISLLLVPKQPKPKKQNLKDVEVPIAKYGEPIVVIFGTVYLKGSNVVWYGDLKRKKIKTKSGK
jgi:hypothetical protein